MSKSKVVKKLAKKRGFKVKDVKLKKCKASNVSGVPTPSSYNWFANWLALNEINVSMDRREWNLLALDEQPSIDCDAETFRNWALGE